MTAEIVAHTSAPFATRYGEWRLHAYEFAGGVRHAALLSPSLDTEEIRRHGLTLRLQSSCITGVAFGALLCDCQQQLEMALQTLQQQPGLLIYLDQEGRGHGWANKVSELHLMRAEGLDTVDAARALHLDIDLREYSSTVSILTDLFGTLPPVRLLTNNPQRVEMLSAAGVEVTERQPFETVPTVENRPYLEVKKRRLGHLLDQV